MDRCTFCNESLLELEDDKSVACDNCGAVWEKQGDKYVLVCEPQVENENL